MGYAISLYFKLTLKEHEMICKEIKHTKDSTNILVDLLNSSKVITKIRDNYLKEYSSYLRLMEAPNHPGVYHIEMYRDYIDETIKLLHLPLILLKIIWYLIYPLKIRKKSKFDLF